MYINVYRDSKNGKEIMQRFEKLEDAKADVAQFEYLFQGKWPFDSTSYSHTETVGSKNFTRFDARKDEYYAA